MRYRCTNCGNKCTISVQRENVPLFCPRDKDRTAVWAPESEALVRDEWHAHIRRCMNEDAKGRQIERINPHNQMDFVVYMSIGEAARKTGINKGAISRAAKSDGHLKAGDYYWKYAEISLPQAKIITAARENLEAYREALKENNPYRYQYVFGENWGVDE